MYKTIRSVGFAVLLFALAVVAIATPQSASAANPPYCDSDIGELTNPDFGGEVPVILVHGLSGGDDDWGSADDASSFAGHINDIPDVEVAHIHNYDTLAWGNGPKLAKIIDCVARLSENNGGYGKVIVIGYSQGGLVTREAVSLQSSDGQRAIADQVGQVITIGTPHHADGVPSFPALLTVHTIAGDVTKVYRDIMGNELRRERPNSDLLVGIASANAARTPNEIEGGGQKTFACEKIYVKKLGWPDWNWLPESFVYNTSPASCEHSQLIVNADNGVREDAAQAIGRYVATLSPPISQPISLTIGSLTTLYDERWLEASYGADGPGDGGDIIARDSTSAVTPPGDHYYAGLFIDHTKGQDCNTIDCFVEVWGTIVGEAPEITVGGRTPDSSARYESAGRNGIAWCFSEEYICVAYSQITTEPIYPSQALLDVFETAVWSN